MDDVIGRIVHLVVQLLQQTKVLPVTISDKHVGPRPHWTSHAGIPDRDGKRG